MGENGWKTKAIGFPSLSRWTALLEGICSIIGIVMYVHIINWTRGTRSL